MNLSQRLVSVLLALILVCVGWIPSIMADCTTQTQIPRVECEALVDLYTSTNGASWTDSTGWNADDFPCSWYGVTCQGSSVQVLNLTSNNLSGSLPSSLGNLTSLQQLYLTANQLTGSVPTELGNLTSLLELWLNSNQLIGTIPAVLGNLSSLTGLSLAGNQLTGSIPSELGNLSSLTRLYLDWNQLTDSIPPELGNLSSLWRLTLYANQLTGTIPTELENLSNLEELYLGRNQLTGTIPSELGNLTSLTILILGNNQLSGGVPLAIAEVGAAANLCDFTNNDSSLCMPGTPPYQAIGEDPICGLPLDESCEPPVPNLHLDKSEIDFGIIRSGRIKEETVTATNTGTIDLVIGSVATTNPLGTPFSIVTDNCSEQALPPSQTCTILIRFAPTNSGDYFDSFDIPSNDSDSPATVSVHACSKFPWLMFGPATTGMLQQ